MIAIALVIFSIVSACLAGSVIEPVTSVKFDTEDKKLALAGVGVRIKKIGPVSLKIYAAGVYVDKVAALLKSKSFASHDISKSKEFDDMLVHGSFEKSVVLKMVRKITGEKMSSALADSVRPRMNGKDQQSLSKFQSILSTSLKDGLTEETVLGFRSGIGGKLSVLVNGALRGDVQSPVLCQALMDVYLGGSPVSPQLKSNTVETFVKWLNKK